VLRVVAITVALNKTGFIHPHGLVLDVFTDCRNGFCYRCTGFLPLIDTSNDISTPTSRAWLAELGDGNDDTDCLTVPHERPRSPHSHARRSLESTHASRSHNQDKLTGEIDALPLGTMGGISTI